MTIRKFEDIPDEKVKWLWGKRLPAGKVVVIDGDPGVSKSTLTLDIAARASTGTPWPFEGPEHRRDPVNVLILSAEDGEGDTIKPRLRSHGADMNRIYSMPDLDRELDGRTLSVQPTFPSCAEALFDAIQATQAKIVLIDPLMAYTTAASTQTMMLRAEKP